MTPPVLLPAAVAVAAVALGLLLGLMPTGRARLAGPLRTFALAAALTVVVTHLLPEAFVELGAPALFVFAAVTALPAWARVVGRLAGGGEHSHAGLKAGYLGLLVHHVGDGLGLGAYGDAPDGGHAHGDVLLALAVHTVPLVAIVSFAFRSAGGTRSAVLASAGLAAASVLGVGASALVPHELTHSLNGWIAAAVAGLLVHVVTHDLARDLPETHGARVLDLAAVALGVGVSLLGGEAELAALRAMLLETVTRDLVAVAPGIVIALVVAAVLGGLSHPLAVRWLAPLPAPALGLDGVACAVALGGGRFGLLFGVGLLLVTRAVALRADPNQPAAAAEHQAHGPLAAVSKLLPWLGAGVLVAGLVRMVPLGSLADVPRLWGLALVLFVALPSRMAACTAVLIAIALYERGLAPGATLAFALVAAAAATSTLGTQQQPSRGRALWALLATALVGVGVGATPTGSPAPTWSLPPALGLAALALLGAVAVALVFFRGLRGVLLAVFPSHDTATAPEH
jgi:ZIP family zinc transporter